METIKQSDIERFNNSFIKEGDCHKWIKHIDKDGYGIFFFRKKNRKAHRFSVYLVNGDIQNGMVVDHLCKNRACVNEKHLRVVTKSQNTLENSNSVGAKNKSKTTCKNGHTFDKTYGIKKIQRYCSICENNKSKRLKKKWLKEANKVLC